VARTGSCGERLAWPGDAGYTLAGGGPVWRSWVMRYEGLVISVCWIPSEAMGGMLGYGMDAGPGHYGAPPPGMLGDLEEWRAAGRFWFANRLRAWIEVDGSGGITGCGYADGGGVIGSDYFAAGQLASLFPGGRAA
jgi:hypothetical protein